MKFVRFSNIVKSPFYRLKCVITKGYLFVSLHIEKRSGKWYFIYNFYWFHTPYRRFWLRVPNITILKVFRFHFFSARKCFPHIGYNHRRTLRQYYKKSTANFNREMSNVSVSQTRHSFKLQCARAFLVTHPKNWSVSEAGGNDILSTQVLWSLQFPLHLVKWTTNCWIHIPLNSIGNFRKS